MTAREGGSFGRNVLVSLVFTVGLAALAFVNSVVIARVAGPEGRGVYSLLVAVLALAVPVASLGLGHWAVFALGKDVEDARVVRLASAVGLSWMLLGSAAAAALAVTRIGFTSKTGWVALAACLAIGPGVLIENARGVYLGRQRVVAYNAVQAVYIALLIVLNVTLAGRGAPWVLVAYTIATWTLALLVAGLIAPWRRAKAVGELWRDATRFGTAAAARALTDAGLLRVDYLVMAPFLPVEAIGVYGVADQITHVMAWGGLTAGKMMFLQSAHDADGEASRVRLGIVVRLLVAVMVMASVVAAATFWWLIPAVFGGRFAGAYRAALILLPASLAKSLHAMVSTYLAGRDVQRPIVRAGAIAIAVEVALTAGLAKTVGLEGVAAGKSVAYLLQLALTLAAFRATHPDASLGFLPRPDDVRFLWRWLVGRWRRRRPPAA